MRLTRALSLALLAIGFVYSSVAASRAQGPTPTPFIPTPGPVVGGSEAATPPPVTVVITATPAEPTPTPTPTLPTLKRDLMGIQIHGFIETNPAWWGMVDRAQFMGFRWIKVQVNWKEMEPEKGQFTQAWTTVRENVFYAGQRGFKMLLSIVNAPDWARPPDARGQQNGPPANPQDYADFVGLVLDSWDKPYINAIELWNEPNLNREWTGAPKDGATYKQYFDAAYNAIRARSADIIVVTAGPAPVGDTPNSVNDRQWLRSLYQAGLPISDPNLAIGVHPYGWANPPDARCCANPSQGWDDQRFFFFLDTIEDYHKIMLEAGHVNGKLWATEFGWPSFQGLRYKDHINGPPAIPPDDPGLAWMTRLSEEQQAQYAVRAFQLAQAGELANFMGPMFLYNMNFAALEGYIKENEPSISDAGFSVLNSDWATRPIYTYLEQSPKE